jgi:hypothetical protein
MRRFASVFASKREKHDATVKRSNTLNTNPPQLIQDHAQSSASSSSGSTSLKTPDDEHHRIPTPLQSKKSWKSWLRVSTVKHPASKWDNKPSIPDWSSQPDLLAHVFDEQDDFVSDESNTPSVPIIPELSPECLANPLSPTRAFQNIQLVVNNSLVSPPSCSPFVQYPETSFIFPRSCNPVRNLPREHSMLSTMLKSRLLRRLEDSSRILSRTEQQDISPLGSRQISPVAPHGSFSLSLDDPVPCNKTSIFYSSPGLHRWRSRYCFEDRYIVFIPTDEGIFRQRVTGTAVAVAALEYSEALDAVAGYVDDMTPLLSPVTSFTSEVPSLETLSTVQVSHLSSQPPCKCRFNVCLPSSLTDSLCSPYTCTRCTLYRRSVALTE